GRADARLDPGLGAGDLRRVRALAAARARGPLQQGGPRVLRPGRRAAMSLPIGIRLPPCTRADEVARLARRAEELGFAQVFLPDSQVLWRDAFLTAYAVALETESI